MIRVNSGAFCAIPSGSYIQSLTTTSLKTVSFRCSIQSREQGPYKLEYLLSPEKGGDYVDPAAASDIDIYLGYDWIQNKPFQ